MTTPIGSALVELRCVLEDLLKDSERKLELDRLAPDERAPLLNILDVTELMLENLRRRVVPTGNGVPPGS